MITQEALCEENKTNLLSRSLAKFANFHETWSRIREPVHHEVMKALVEF